MVSESELKKTAGSREVDGLDRSFGGEASKRGHRSSG